MSHAERKMGWCLKKAEEGFARRGTHRGLIRRTPDTTRARAHIAKAKHNLDAIIVFHETGFSDWSASAAFYAAYHRLLAILAKHGFESRNQKEPKMHLRAHHPPH